LDVRSDEEGLALPGLAELEGELRAGRRLAASLEARHENDGRASLLEADGGVDRPHERRELSIDEIDELLTRLDALEDLLAERLLLDAREELLDDADRDVRFEERDADLPERLLDVALGDLASVKAAKDVGETPRDRFEHELCLVA